MGLLLTNEGIIILDNAFEYKERTDKTIPKYIKDLFPYVIKVDNTFKQWVKLNIKNLKQIVKFT